MTVNVFNMADTWNDSGTVFTGIKMNVTNTASAAGSLLTDLQIGGVSKFNVDVSGIIQSVQGGQTALIKPATEWQGNAAYRFGLAGSSYTNCIGPQNGFMATVGGGFHIGESLDSPTSTTVTSIQRDANHIFAQRSLSHPAAAQTFRVYNTYTDSSNYERGVFDWTTSANVLTIDVQVLGSGTQRVISLNHLDAATGSGTATFAATNCPATTLTSPYTWIKVTSSDGSIVYMPAWK